LKLNTTLQKYVYIFPPKHIYIFLIILYKEFRAKWINLSISNV